MQQISKGLWKVDNPSKLELYKANSGSSVYWIWADSIETAHEKAKNWRKNYSIDDNEKG